MVEPVTEVLHELPDEPGQLYRWSREDVTYVLDRVEALVDKIIDKSARATEEVAGPGELEVPVPEREPEPEAKPERRRVV